MQDHLSVGTTVRSVDGRYGGRVVDVDSYGWPIVDARSFEGYAITGRGTMAECERHRVYEAPGYWRVVA